MGRKVFFNGKVYKPTTPGAALEPGTVDWELARRQFRAQRRHEKREEKQYELMKAEKAAIETTGFWRILDARATCKIRRLGRRFWRKWNCSRLTLPGDAVQPGLFNI